MNAELENYFRIRRKGELTALEINIVSWPQLHTPVENWKLFRTWTTPPTQKEITDAKQAAFLDPHFFARCGHCKKAFPTGQMHDRKICHTCAEEHLGIVH